MPRTAPTTAELEKLIIDRTTIQTAPDTAYTLHEFSEETEKVVWKLQDTIERLEDKLADLAMENTDLKERVEELEERVDHLTLPGALLNSPHARF